MKSKFKTLLLAAVTLTFTHCQREEATEPLAPQAASANEPVSFAEAKNLFESTQAEAYKGTPSARAARSPLQLQPLWEYFKQTQTPWSEAYSKVPITIGDTDLDAQVLFVKREGHTRHYLFLTEVDSLTPDQRIVNADFYLLTPTGKFLSAYRMTDGCITHQLVPKKKGTYQLVVEEPTHRSHHRKKREQVQFKEQGGEGCTECSEGEDDEFGIDIQLEEVVLVGKMSGGNRYPYVKDPFDSFKKYNDPKYYGHDYNESDVGIRFIGGGGGNNHRNDIKDDIPKPEEKIIDSLKNPCAKAVLDEIPNLKDDMANLLRETFGTSDKINITFSEKNTLSPNVDGETSGFYNPTDRSVIDIEIALNSNILKTATKEYILATMYHEVVHAFLRFEKKQIVNRGI